MTGAPTTGSKIELPLKPSVETLQQQIDSGKEAVKVLQNLTDRAPTASDVQWQVTALKELTNVRFEGMEKLFGSINDTRDKYEDRIADILAKQKDKDALLLSTQVDKLGVTTGERLSLIEKNQYAAGGSAAVRDPAIADAIAAMSIAISKLSNVGAKTEGATTQQDNAQKFVFLIIGAIVGLSGLAFGLVGLLK